MAATAGSSNPDPGDIATADIHGVLSNERRRLTIEFLQENGGEMTARELSEQIAIRETGEDPPPRNIRQSAYVSLHQTHLPRLDELGIITYDSNAKQVRLEDAVDEVAVYMETVPKYGIAWSELYTGLAVLGLLTVTGAGLGTPVLSAVPVAVWSIVFFGLIGASAVYQTYRQGSSIINRLTSEPDD